MSFTFGEKQPYRIWFDYLKTCMNDDSLNEKINKDFYKEWNLVSVKNEKFDTWFSKHEHLFTDRKTEIKIKGEKVSLNTICVEIPINYTITEVQNKIGKVIKDKINKKSSKFKITSNRPLILPPFDYFLYAWKIKKTKKKLSLEKVWEKVDEEIRERQKKVSKLVDKNKLKRRWLMGKPFNPEARNKAVLISRNIKKAERILLNVCSGIFPGEYSDN
jgi:hypothetical protein